MPVQESLRLPDQNTPAPSKGPGWQSSPPLWDDKLAGDPCGLGSRPVFRQFLLLHEQEPPRHCACLARGWAARQPFLQSCL